MIDKKKKFIEKATKRHNGKYDYSKVEYVDSLTKVCIICPEHGEFWQTPQAHVRGNNCPKCANIKRGDTFRSNGEEFIKKATAIHNGKYIYDKKEYANAMTKVPILCLKHGTFWMTPMAHLLGQGCPKCSGRGLNTDEVIELFKEKHGDKYDYSKVVYTKMHEKVCIICPEHGEFWQTPSKHISGQNCPKCAKLLMAEKNNLGVEEFIKRSIEKWGNLYDYSKIESKSEIELYNIICGMVGKENVIHNDRKILNGKEIDILIPEYNIGIEFNGLKWHSETHLKDRHYHISKSLEANSHNIKLIHIFEDEWINKKELVIDKIKHILNKNNDKTKIFARKCTVSEINKNDAETFLNANHIQGFINATVYIGCFYKDSLMGVMTFLQESKNNWNLNRFSTNIDYVCCGIGGKLLKYFIEKYKPINIKSFADRRWTFEDGENIYNKLGFKLVNELKPDYKYVNRSNPIERIHKFNFRKEYLHKKYGLPLTMTELEMTKKLGYDRIWDCGLLKYEYITKQKN